MKNYFYILIFLSIILDGVRSELIKQKDCKNSTLNEQYSFTFLVCEATPGWSAAHVILPMSLTIMIQNVWICLLIPGLFEVFEAFIGAALQYSYFVETASETIAGSLVGDWLFNGFMGVILGFFIVNLTKVPVLLPIIKSKRVKFWSWIKYFFVGALSCSLLNIIIEITYPSGCEEIDPFSCNNLGLLLFLIIKPFYLILYLLLISFKIDEIYIWKNYPKKGRYFTFALWYVVELSICIQNLQNWVPLYLGPAGGFYQVWLSVGFWVFVFSIFIIIFKLNPDARLDFEKSFLGNTRRKLIEKKSLFNN